MSQPNVLIFMTDQQRAVTVDPEHRLKADTPHIDRFREDATHFGRCYAPSPHCCPSRTSFFTGLYPSEHGVWNNVNVPNALSRGPRPGTHFWSEDFRTAGYRLGFTGKWHVSNAVGPAAYGWEELEPVNGAERLDVEPDVARSVAIKDERDGLQWAKRSTQGHDRQPGEIIRPGWPQFHLYGTDDDAFGDGPVTQAAEDYIRSAGDDQDTPWMLYAGTLGPHDPYRPPARFLDRYDPESIELPASFADPMNDKPALYRRVRDRFDQLTEAEHREALRHYLAFCSYQDELFGQLLETLRETGQYENTIVVYVSDHGDYTAEHGLWTKGLPAFLPGYHVPLMIKPAGRGVVARTCDTPVTLQDVGPTLLDLCHVSGAESSGRSLTGAMEDPTTLPERDVFLQSNGNEVYGIQRTVVSGRWKLVVNLFDLDELYDLEADPDEMINLLAIPAETRRVGKGPLDSVPEDLRPVVEDLYGRLWQFVADHDDEIMNPYIFTALTTYGPLEA